MNIKRGPHKAKPGAPGTAAGWWYENKASIDVYVELRDNDGNHLGTGVVWISRRSIMGWLKRTGGRG
jgi:hypothetical protein